MAYRHLGEYLEALQHVGALVRVPCEVDHALEIAEITRRVGTTNGPALLFGAVKGHDLAVLTNLLTTESRICLALGVNSLSEVGERLLQRMAAPESAGWLGWLGQGPHAGWAGAAPRQVKAAACQQIVRLGGDVDLTRLPLLKTTPHETVAALTGVAVFAAEADSHASVVGQYDVQLLDHGRLVLGCAAHDDLARLHRDYRERGRRMPLAIVVGGDPAFLLAAAAPLPSGSDICAAAGLLREKPLDVVTCRSVELAAPAEAEIVIEGYCDPGEPPATFGPLCGPLGQSSGAWPAPIMHVTAVTHRANPLFAATVPGRPPHEALCVARTMQRVFWPLLRQAVPEVLDYDLPLFGAARHWAAVSVRPLYPGQTRRAAAAAWGLRPLQFAKVLILVDEDVDVHDSAAVLAAVAANMNPAADVFFSEGPADPYDPAWPSPGLSRRMGIDATRKPRRAPGAPPAPVGELAAVAEAFPPLAAQPDPTQEEIAAYVSRRWTQYGLGGRPS